MTPARPRRFIPLFLFLSVFALFWPSLGASFQWDDRYLFLTNPRFGPWNLRWMFTTFLMGHYVPFTWLSWTLDRALWGDAAAGFHLTNVLLHAANTLFVFYVARRLMVLGTGDGAPARLDEAAAAAAFLFAAHPLRVETVAWITERRGLLCAFFSLAATWADLSGDVPSTKRRAASFVLFLAALLSKAAAISLPAVWLVLDVYPRRRSLKDRRPWIERAPFFLAAGLFTLVAGAAQREAGAALGWADYGPLQRLAQAFYGPVFLLAKTAWPAGLSPLYELKVDFDPLTFPFPAAAAAFLCAAGLIFHFRRRAPALAAAALCCLAFLAPTSGVFQSGPQIVADRYSYFSGIGWAVAAGAWFLSARRKGGAPARGALAAVLALGLASSALAWRQEAYWKTPLSLWDRAAALSPGSSVVRFNRGQSLQDLGRWPEALEEYREALRIRPTMHQAAYNAAWVYQKTGDLRRAESFYRLALWIKPDYVEACNNLGGLLLEKGRAAEAAVYFRRALALVPGDPKFRVNLARAESAGAAR